MINVSSHAEIKEGIAELQAAQVAMSTFLQIIFVKYSCQLFLLNILANNLASYLCQIFSFQIVLPDIFVNCVDWIFCQLFI